MTTRRWWELDPKTRSLAASALSGAHELFHGNTQSSHEVREQEKRQGIELNDEGDPMKITIKKPKIT